MDSANSGSLQSSSGGDDEYDSRAADSVSTFMSGGGGGGGGGPIPHPPPSFFDPLSGYLQLHQNTNSSLLNSNLSWPRTSSAPPPLRSDPNPMGHEVVPSMFPTSNPFMPCFQQPMGADGGGAAAAPPLNQSQAAARNPKKRSRASRRAPTTVLTTDTTNFRAMVQEFTGIPAPPFNSSSSSFPRSRLDFFGSRSTAFDAAPPPPYLRRPFPHKPFLDTNTNTNTNTTPTASASTSMNYQLPMTHTSNLFNIPNQNQNQSQNQNLLTSLLQSNPKFPFSTSSIITTKPQNSIEQFNLGHNNHQQVSETLAALPNLIPSDHSDAADVSNAARWGSNPSGDKDDDNRINNLRPLNGSSSSYDFQRNNTMDGKMGYSVSSTSGFHGGKAPENVNAAAAVRGEGMVESWICSSE